MDILVNIAVAFGMLCFQAAYPVPAEMLRKAGLALIAKAKARFFPPKQ